ncbi:MAG: hypothetical protein U1F43_05415 [Myxococcota bacterium]
MTQPHTSSNKGEKKDGKGKKDGVEHKPGQDQNTGGSQPQPKQQPPTPTPSRVAAKDLDDEDETMANKPGTYQSPRETGPGKREVDSNTMSDQPDSFRKP